MEDKATKIITWTKVIVVLALLVIVAFTCRYYATYEEPERTRSLVYRVRTCETVLGLELRDAFP